jgi:hypothetical protein
VIKRSDLKILLLIAILAMTSLCGLLLPDTAIMWVITLLALCQLVWWVALFAGEERDRAG